MFKKNDPRINRNGRPKLTKKQKIQKKALREVIKEYKEGLTLALPLIEPIIIKKAQKGDMVAIKEIHDRVMGRVVNTEEPPSNNYFLQVIQQIINEPGKTIVGERRIEIKREIIRPNVEDEQPLQDNKQGGSANPIQTKQATDLLTGEPAL